MGPDRGVGRRTLPWPGSPPLSILSMATDRVTGSRSARAYWQSPEALMGREGMFDIGTAPEISSRRRVFLPT